MSNEYILVNIDQSISHLNGGRYWRLTFVSLDDGTQHEMTVDPAYTNFKKSGWNHIVEDPYPYGVYSGLRRTSKKTRSGVPVVSADGKARIVYRCADDAELAALVEVTMAQSKPPATQFGQLFDYGNNYGEQSRGTQH
jgi:hypothetical protein